VVRVADACQAELVLQVGGPGHDGVFGVAPLTDGGTLVGGFFEDAISLGATELTRAGETDGFVASVDAAGVAAWVLHLGDPGFGGVKAVAVLPDGGAVIAGVLSGDTTVGDELLTGEGALDAFAARLASNGEVQWARRFGGPSDDGANAVAVDAEGNAVVMGTFAQVIDLGTGPLSSAGPLDIFAVRLDAEGETLWARRFGGDGYGEYATSVDIGAGGDIVLHGGFAASIDFGGGPLVAEDGADIFLARLTADGEHVWSKRYGSGSINQGGNGVRFDAAGNVLVVGNFVGEVDFGGGTLAWDSPDGWPTAYFAKLDGDGNHVWSRRANGSSTGDAIAPSADGGVMAAGGFLFEVDIGNGPLVADGHRAFVAKLGP
jgi:hypothetical protein